VAKVQGGDAPKRTIQPSHEGSCDRTIFKIVANSPHSRKNRTGLVPMRLFQNQREIFAAIS